MQIDNDLNVHLLHHSIVCYFEHHTKYVSQDFSEFQEKEQLTSKHNKKTNIVDEPLTLYFAPSPGQSDILPCTEAVRS